MSVAECVGLLALTAGFVTVAVWGIRGAQRDDARWRETHRATCPLECCRD